MSLLNTKITLSFRILIILALLALSSPQDFVINLPSTQLSLNQNADYKLGTGPFDMTGYFIPSGSVLLLTLPPQYNTTALRSKTYAGYSATYGDNCFFDFACTGVTVSFEGNSFAISGMFTSDIQISDTWSFQYTILSVQNPNTLSLGAFAVTIYLGSTIHYPSAGTPSSTTFKSTLAAQAVTYTVQVMNPTIWGVSPLKLTITPNNVIDTIRIRFPSTAWTGETRTNTAATTSGLTFISTSHPTITATNLVSFYAITNLNYYTALVPIDITVNSITNPSSLMAAGSIVLSLVSNNNILQTSTFSIPANSFTNDVLRNIATTLTDLASDKVQVQLKFQFAEINANTDKIYVTFPTQLVLPTTTSSYTIKMATVTVSPALTINTGTNTVSFNISSASIFQIAVILTVTGISRPRQCKTTSSFSVKTLRQNLNLMDSNTCCSLQLANRQSLIVNSIALSNSRRLQTSVTYTFTFTTSVVNLITTDMIQIQFPAQYKNIITAANSAALCATVTIAGVNFPAFVKAPSCSITLNQLILSSFLTGSPTGSETFIVTLGGVTNPSSSPSTGFTISTLSSSSYVLEQSQGNTITIQPNTLTSFTVNANSLQTCAANTIYSFTLGNNSPLSNGYTISITFPADFTYINYNTIQCKINAVIYVCTRANSTYHTNNNIVIVQVSATINTITSLTISSVTNPISQATTSSFSASIYDQTGTAVESSSGSATITMTSTSSFYLFTATATNYSAATSVIQSAVQTISTVSNSVWLTIATPFTPLVTPSSLLIIFSNANHLSYNVLSTCVSAQISSLCTLTTNIGTNNVEVSFPSLTFTTPTSNLLQIEITFLTILNHQQLQITTTMSINSFASLSLSPASSISKVYAEPVSNYAVALSSQILGQACTATLTITLSAVTLTQLSSFTVYVPLQFGASSRIINVPLASFVSNQITIASLTNPTVKSYTPFLFTAFNSNGNVIAFSTPTLPSKVYGFTLGCTLPCRTCSSSTVCIDCYTTVSWIPQIYFRNSAQTCVSQCVWGEYLSNGVCLPCDPTCLACLMYSSSSYANGISTYCLTCVSTKLLHINTCVDACPSGFYASQSNCRSCMANCLNCTDYSTCSSCQSGYSLYSNKCISTCPDSTVSFTNVATSQASCVSCPSNCISCSNVASPLCLSCQYPYYLYNGVCHLSCSSLSLFISYQMTCDTCQCLTCVNFAYNCASCAAPYNLYQSQCIINCPTGYFSSLNVCQACTTDCLSCTSSAYCLLCQIPFALLIASPASATCQATCPVNTIATIDSSSFVYVCAACGGNCLTCQTSITFCLSCKPSFILNNNTCVSGCPSDRWMILGICVTCSPACRVCSASDPYNCTLCSLNYFYFNFTCGLFCPTGTYPDVIALACKSCNVVCSACMNATNCTACASGFYLYNSYCYNNCLSINSLFYNYNGTCMACQPQCATCLSTPVQCSSCASSSYYFNPVDSSCSLSCIAPYYINGATCSLCQSPCSTCDTLYDSCLTCIGTLSVFNGKCYANCPSGYYSSSNICIQCASACLTCTASACQTCQTYAYRFKQTCILNCSTSVLPITIDNYCTSCASVPYCEACQTTANNNYVCFSCIFPYVIFQGNCLNQCPNLYAVDSTSNTCLPTAAYSEYINRLYYDNYPYFPPFCFFALLLIAAIILIILSNKVYKYTYHFGYLIALCASVQLLFIIYGLGYIIGLYQGDYTKQNKWIPVFVVTGSYFCKMVLGAIFAIFVLGNYYLKDLRFKEWKEQHQRGFKVSVLLTIIFGPRFYKLYYSKLLGKQIFSYRIISVQKFYYEDIIIWISFLFDIADVSAMVIINYNIFITYAVLYFLSFQLLLFKAAQWIMLAYDLKKPDRGFFLGDEEEAERMIQEQKEAKQREKRKFEMESLVKLIRRKSAGNLYHEKLYDNLFIDDFHSVFDPSDYEDVPKVPNKKIEKNINKGKFRKGKRITIEQKLKRFAESIKPSPAITKQNGYIKNLLYWKPPKQLKVQPKKAPEESQHSMMKLLEDKELYYEDITSIQIIDLDDESGVERDMPSRFRKRKRTGFGVDGQQTVINDTFDHMYDPNSVEFLQPDDHDVNGLWNRNYAKKQHLPQNISHNRYDQNQLRVLYHEPLKKRRSKLNELRSRHF